MQLVNLTSDYKYYMETMNYQFRHLSPISGKYFNTMHSVDESNYKLSAYFTVTRLKQYYFAN